MLGRTGRAWAGGSGGCGLLAAEPPGGGRAPGLRAEARRYPTFWFYRGFGYRQVTLKKKSVLLTPSPRQPEAECGSETCLESPCASPEKLKPSRSG